MEAVNIVVNVIVGAILVPLLDALKRRTGLKGTPMRWVTYLSIFLVTLGVGLVFKAFGNDFTPEGFVTGAGVLGLANQVTYAVYKAVIENFEKER